MKSSVDTRQDKNRQGRDKMKARKVLWILAVVMSVIGLASYAAASTRQPEKAVAGLGSAASVVEISGVAIDGMYGGAASNNLAPKVRIQASEDLDTNPLVAYATSASVVEVSNVAISGMYGAAANNLAPKVRGQTTEALDSNPLAGYEGSASAAGDGGLAIDGMYGGVKDNNLAPEVSRPSWSYPGTTTSPG